MNDRGRRLVGAVLGAAAGALVFWLLRHFAAKASFAVGAGMSLGISAASRQRSLPWALATCLAATLLTLAVEWWFFPFASDASPAYFLQHLRQLPTTTQLSLLAVAAIGLYFGAGRRRAPPAGPRRVSAP